MGTHVLIKMTMTETGIQNLSLRGREGWLTVKKAGLAMANAGTCQEGYQGSLRRVARQLGWPVDAPRGNQP